MVREDCDVGNAIYHNNIVLQWMNDLEKDKLYSAWPRSLHEVC